MLPLALGPVLGSFNVGDNVKIGGGSVVLNSVPPDCTVVGVPGRIVVREGSRIDHEAVDLEHHMLPDPVADMLTALQEKIKNLEDRIEAYEKEADQDEDIQYSRCEKRRISNA